MALRHRYATDLERRTWQNPEQILAGIGLKKGQVFMDIGCGNGFFALPAARIVGVAGKVYGLDKEAAFINELEEKANEEGLANLETRVEKAENAVICQECADFVFFGIVLHDFENPGRVLKNAYTMLKPEGKLVNLDWKKEPMEYGPPVQIRFSPQEASSLIKSAGFEIETVKESGPYHYLIIAKK